MNKWNLFNWKLQQKTRDTFSSYETREKFKYIKGSVFAIVLGLIVAGIIIAAQNVNPFIYLRELFNVSFSSLFVEQTFQWLAIYIIVGLAVGLGFKSGVFNIGVSGQMLLGAGIGIIYYRLAVGNGNVMHAGDVIVVFLICLFSGAFLAGIAGALKALFNIHEVVTTIMLNWTVWYLLKFLFTRYQSLSGAGISTSASMPSDQLAINGSSIAVPLIIAVVCLVIVAFLLSKTVFGYKLKAVGSSPNAAKYAGFNVKAKIVESMLISGGLAGVASFVNVLTLNPNISFTVDNLPAIGYDAIAISLVAFNNPIGIFFTSFLWGILQSGGAGTASLFNMSNQTSSLIFGIIVYFAAISVLFINYYPILRLKINLARISSRTTREQVHQLALERQKIIKARWSLRPSMDVQNYTQAMKEEKHLLKLAYQQEQKLTYGEYRKQVKAINQQIRAYVRDYRKNLREIDKKLGQAIKTVKKDNYIQRLTLAKQGIKRRERLLLRISDQNALGGIGEVKTTYIRMQDHLKAETKKKYWWLKTQLVPVKAEYRQKVYEIKAWYEGESGDLTQRWTWLNLAIETRGEIEKQKIKTKNKVESLRINYRLDKSIIRRNKALSGEEKEQQILGLKATTTDEILTLKQEKKALVDHQKSLALEAKLAYQTTKNNSQVKTKLKSIKKSYHHKMDVAKKAYQKKVAALKAANKARLQQFDKTTSQGQIAAMKGFVGSYQNYKKELKVQGVYSGVYLNKLAEKIELMWTEFQAINHDDFFDAQDTWVSFWVKKRLYHWLAKEEKWVEESKLVYTNLDETRAIKVDTKRIMTTYKQNLTNFSQDYKTEKQQIINNEALNHQERGLMLNEHEQLHTQRLQDYILDLEAKTRSRSFLESESK